MNIEQAEEFIEDITDMKHSLQRITEHLERNVLPVDSYGHREAVGAICETIREGFELIARKL